MKVIHVPAQELWDEGREEFLYTPATEIPLEHSLASLSKWEAKWHVPFLDKKDRTNAEMVDYIRCMSLDPTIPPDIFQFLTQENYEEVSEYIADTMTATWFAQNRSTGGKSEIVTAEVIYYWMIRLGIPMECETWHLNRLLTLIRVCSEKNAEETQHGSSKNPPGGNMTRREILAENAEINRMRRAALGTKG